jgi:hypothetical protein
VVSTVSVHGARRTLLLDVGDLATRRQLAVVTRKTTTPQRFETKQADQAHWPLLLDYSAQKQQLCRFEPTTFDRQARRIQWRRLSENFAD